MGMENKGGWPQIIGSDSIGEEDEKNIIDWVIIDFLNSKDRVAICVGRLCLHIINSVSILYIIYYEDFKQYFMLNAFKLLLSLSDKIELMDSMICNQPYVL